MVGQYIKCLKSGYWDKRLESGEYLKIVSESKDLLGVSWDKYTDSPFSKDRFKDIHKAFELMPKGWTPNQNSSILENFQLF